jgi:hypothetical protein
MIGMNLSYIEEVNKFGILPGFRQSVFFLSFLHRGSNSICILKCYSVSLLYTA